jgi:hypothetical protein
MTAITPLPGSLLARVFWPALAATLLLMLILNLVGAPLETPAAPYGIISFELAGSPVQASTILDSWDPAAKVRAGFSLGLDYLFMLAYASALSLACLWAAAGLRSRRWPLGGLGLPLAAGQWLAALFDAAENIALALLLFGYPAGPLPQAARICALLKFGLIFLGMVYAFLGAAARLVPARE